MKVVDSLKDLANRLRRIFFCELAVLADPIEQFTASG